MRLMNYEQFFYWLDGVFATSHYHHRYSAEEQKELLGKISKQMQFVKTVEEKDNNEKVKQNYDDLKAFEDYVSNIPFEDDSDIPFVGLPPVQETGWQDMTPEIEMDVPSVGDPIDAKQEWENTMKEIPTDLPPLGVPLEENEWVTSWDEDAIAEELGLESDK